MGHAISAIILKGAYDLAKAKSYDLIGTELDSSLTMFFIDGYFTACWQKQAQNLVTLQWFRT